MPSFSNFLKNGHYENADVVLLRRSLLESANKSLAAVFQRVGLEISPETALSKMTLMYEFKDSLGIESSAQQLWTRRHAKVGLLAVRRRS